MKRLIIITLLMCFFINNQVKAGAIGLQLGRVTFGIGGSSNGPIIGIGPSPDNGLPIAVPFVPDGCCSRNYCSSYDNCSTCDQVYDYDEAY